MICVVLEPLRVVLDLLPVKPRQCNPLLFQVHGHGKSLASSSSAYMVRIAAGRRIPFSGSLPYELAWIATCLSGISSIIPTLFGEGIQQNVAIVSTTPGAWTTWCICKEITYDRGPNGHEHETLGSTVGSVHCDLQCPAPGVETSSDSSM